jgi:hypothetical protein
MNPDISYPPMEVVSTRGVVSLLASSSSSSRLATAREMLDTLETLTNAGQRHLMEKVAAFIDGHLATAAWRQRPPAVATEILTSLKQESERLSPQVSTFRGLAEKLLALLAPLA